MPNKYLVLSKKKKSLTKKGQHANEKRAQEWEVQDMSKSSTECLSLVQLLQSVVEQLQRQEEVTSLTSRMTEVEWEDFTDSLTLTRAYVLISLRFERKPHEL